ncbi:MAG: peptidoglycan-binding protein, partial [Candidatus Dormibacteraeota bacterium]|nr:peptidoglycan-binding protein [Candidatus Dormibacteraeota bacterium]
MTGAGRFLLLAGVAMVLLLGFDAARLSVQGSTHAAAATQSISTTQVQWDLAGLGYLPWSGIDGVYGPQTTAAVKTFQSNVCIAVDGVAGPQTDASLGSVVQAVQGKVGATQDGLFGPQTKAGVEAYQRAHGLTVDGQAGPVTMGAMGITRVHSCASAAPPPAAAPRTPTPAPRAPATPAVA